MVFYNFWIALAAFGVGILVCLIIGVIMLKNPFSLILEGKGLLALDFSSSGVIRPFIVSVQQPFIKGNFNGEPLEDVFNREAVYQLAVPEKQGKAYIIQGKDKEGKETKGVAVVLDEDAYNKARFAFFHYPVLIYNSQLKCFLTKDMLMEREKEIFSEHLLLYLNRKIEELTSLIRDFARYIVELTKPKTNWLAGKWGIIIMIVLGIILLAMFAPTIIDSLKGSGIGAAVGSTLPNQPVTPMG